MTSRLADGPSQVAVSSPAFPALKLAAALLLLILLAPAYLRAAPAVSGAVNAASFRHSSLPDGKLAPGSLVSLFGQEMGPGAPFLIPFLFLDPSLHADGFPLPTVLGTTSVQVTVNGITLDCAILFASYRQVTILLPSATPAGTGTLTLTYDGETSEPLEIEVVPHSFGIFSTSQNGSGSGVVTDPFTTAANSLVTSANPGHLLDLWGTGLGAVAGTDLDEETARPVPGDLPSLDVRVFVAGQEAEVVYRGRSGCCAGVDQVRFLVLPDAVSGCHVPVHAEVNGVASNFLTISIAPEGAYCDIPGSWTASDMQTLDENGELRTGAITLNRSSFLQLFPGPSSENVSASFRRTLLRDLQPTERSALNLLPSFSIPPASPLAPGTCTVNQTGDPAAPGRFVFSDIEDFLGVRGLEAGTIEMSGPEGRFDLYDTGFGNHSLSFLPGLDEELADLLAELFGPGIITDGTLLTSGTHNFTATGGNGNQNDEILIIPPREPVGRFTATIDLPSGFEPLYGPIAFPSPPVINRSQPHTVRWQNAPAGSLVSITGTSLLFSALDTHFGSIGPRGSLVQIFSEGMSFQCWARGEDGSFTVPPEILSLLPPSSNTGFSGFDDGLLQLDLVVSGPRFTAEGLDAGITQYRETGLPQRVVFE